MQAARYRDTKDPNRCTAHAMKAIGVEGVSPFNSIGCVLAAQDHGYEHKLVMKSDPNDPYQCTFEWKYWDFVQAHKTGTYLIFTRDHAIALVDGVITDTMDYAVTNRVKVTMAYQLTKKETVN